MIRLLQVAILLVAVSVVANSFRRVDCPAPPAAPCSTDTECGCTYDCLDEEIPNA